MGMFDEVRCEYPLPGTTENSFQTKSFGDGFVGGFMDNYTITEDGQLILHKEAWEAVPEEERPYYGKPGWNKNPLLQLAGCMKSIPMGDEVIEYHGILNMYTSVNDEWIEFNIKFTDGKVSNVEHIEKGL